MLKIRVKVAAMFEDRMANMRRTIAKFRNGDLDLEQFEKDIAIHTEYILDIFTLARKEVTELESGTTGLSKT